MTLDGKDGLEFGSESAELKVDDLVSHCAHLLPGQRPLEAFVHHNTLHAFEHLPFEEAVEEAARIFNAQPYMAEEAFRERWRSGRILDRDLDAAIALRVPLSQVEQHGVPLREAVKSLMLGLEEPDGGPSLEWRIECSKTLSHLPEDLPRQAFERLVSLGPVPEVQARLWEAARRSSLPPKTRHERPRRPQEWLLDQVGEDSDELVHPTLIRWCGAFLDGGNSYWPISDRAKGFYVCVLLHLASGPTPRRWMRSASARAKGLLSGKVSPQRCILETAARMGVEEEGLEELVQATLLAMPGWPGMFVQLKARPDLAPAPMPPTELVEFVAVRLLLDEAAGRHIAKSKGQPLLPKDPQIAVTEEHSPAWALFTAARRLGVSPAQLREPAVAEAIRGLLDDYDNVRRRSIWQLAFERRYRITILDGVLAHGKSVAELAMPAPRAQIVTCIDDREESLRRHIEEIDGAYQTFGVAGYYGVSMYYQALGDPHSTPLCPANVVPKHLIKELPQDVKEWERVSAGERKRGVLAEGLRVGQNTLFRGGLLTLGGLGQLLPMAGRVLFPGAYARLKSARERPATELQLLAESPPLTEHGLQLGFSLEEMVAIAQRFLEDMSLVKDFAPLVVVLGHGSRSMNNPHEAAHDCGACGGGRGGPNARAFAAMVNRADVRAALQDLGIQIPEQTWFLGGYHNTADDQIEFYDLEDLPSHLVETFGRTQRDLDQARARDAHERCRRFESADLDMEDFGAALTHVEMRVEDLAQPRPEYGHCTNALCVVGDRAFTRGLFLDRRVFLQSYDPEMDPDLSILERVLAMVGPVGAGINLEYYFSFVDPDRYGSNTKLPHNITGLLGVMDGHSSDLRVGLPWQMVEIHEPIRLLNIIQATPEQLLEILERQPELRALVVNRWILVVAHDPEQGKMWFFNEGGFELYEPESTSIPVRETSTDWYSGSRAHLEPATIRSGYPEGAIQ